MSYDLHLVPRHPGVDPLSAARALLEQRAEGLNPGPPVPEKEARKARLAAALMKSSPPLSAFAFEYSAIAARQHITEEEARARYRHIELNGPENGNGIQITLSDDTAGVTIPYWHRPAAAASVFDDVWWHVALLERDGGFAVYGPQLDRILDLAIDGPAVLECYGGGVAQTAKIGAQTRMPAKRWWRFW
ncbi:MAG TPA: hypothetical protein VL086_04310 [Candidatus Nitrosotalea sp.]|nr:hypothetical protein [Candidatus Nitrosotalea sp.]